MVLAAVRVAALPPVDALIVTRFPAVPVATKLDTVWVVPLVKVTVLGLLIVKVLKVLEPLIVKAPDPVFTCKLL